MNIRSPKIAALQMGPKYQNDDFTENGSNDFDYISPAYGDHKKVR
jgi:hypothetical protein